MSKTTAKNKTAVKLVTLITLSLFVFSTGMFMFPTSLSAQANDQTNDQTIDETPRSKLKTGTLKGFIYRRNVKRPFWGAQVLLTNTDTGMKFESNVTDGVGDYTVTDLPAGDYKMQIMARDRDYKIKTVDFQIKIMEGKTTTVSFALKKRCGFPIILGLEFCEILSIIATIAAVVAII